METEKFYLTTTGEEVHIGDTIKGTIKRDNSITKLIVTLTEDLIPMLTELGVLITPEKEQPITIPSEEDVIKETSNILKLSYNDTKDLLDKLAVNMPAVKCSIMLKSLAIILDRKYKDHISKSDRIFGVSIINGKIGELPKEEIRNYRNFAAFRTIEDARIACKVLRKQFKEMFKNE